MKLEKVFLLSVLLITGSFSYSAQHTASEQALSFLNKITEKAAESTLTPEQQNSLEKIRWLASKISFAGKSLYQYRKPLTYGLAGLGILRGGKFRKIMGIGAVGVMQRYDKESLYHHYKIKSLKARIWFFITKGLESSKIIKNIGNTTAARLKTENFPKEFIDAQKAEQLTSIQGYIKGFQADITHVEQLQELLRFYINDKEVYAEALNAVARDRNKNIQDIQEPHKRSIDVEEGLDNYMKTLESLEKKELFGWQTVGGKFQYSKQASLWGGYAKWSYTSEVVQEWWKLQKIKEVLKRAQNYIFKIINPEPEEQQKEDTLQKTLSEIGQEVIKTGRERINTGIDWVKSWWS